MMDKTETTPTRLKPAMPALLSSTVISVSESRVCMSQVLASQSVHKLKTPAEFELRGAIEYRVLYPWMRSCMVRCFGIWTVSARLMTSSLASLVQVTRFDKAAVSQSAVSSSQSAVFSVSDTDCAVVRETPMLFSSSSLSCSKQERISKGHAQLEVRKTAQPSTSPTGRSSSSAICGGGSDSSGSYS